MTHMCGYWSKLQTLKLFLFAVAETRINSKNGFEDPIQRKARQVSCTKIRNIFECENYLFDHQPRGQLLFGNVENCPRKLPSAIARSCINF